MMGLGDPTILDRFVQREIDHPSPRKMPDSHGRIIYTSCSDFGEAPTDVVIASAKITDIGLAAWGTGKNTKPIQSNAFMAPEVILQAGWSYPADIWNLGVMLWDLFETFGLFDAMDTRPGHYRPEKHLGLMIALLGPPPVEFLKRGAKSSHYFDNDGKFKYPDYIDKEISFDSSIQRLRGEEKELFLDMAQHMICWVPEERWTAKQLLEHPYLTKERDYIPTPGNLSRASTASFQSIIPSRTGTPNPAPSNSVSRRTSNLERIPSREYLVPNGMGTSPDKPSSRPTTPATSTMTLPHHVKRSDDKNGSSAMTSPGGHLALSHNVANKCSQDLIDSILSKGRNHNGQNGQNNGTTRSSMDCNNTPTK